MILKVEADHLGIWGQRINTLLAACAKKLDCGHITQLGIIEFGDRRGIHHIASFDLDWIGVRGGDMTVAADIFVKFHMHQSIFFKAVHLTCLAFTGFKKTQRFGDRHLIDKDLTLVQRLFGDPVPGLDHSGITCSSGRRNSSSALKESPY